jgi:hypothetical protein
MNAASGARTAAAWKATEINANAETGIIPKPNVE